MIDGYATVLEILEVIVSLREKRRDDPEQIFYFLGRVTPKQSVEIVTLLGKEDNQCVLTLAIVPKNWPFSWNIELAGVTKSWVKRVDSRTQQEVTNLILQYAEGHI